MPLFVSDFNDNRHKTNYTLISDNLNALQDHVWLAPGSAVLSTATHAVLTNNSTATIAYADAVTSDAIWSDFNNQNTLNKYVKFRPTLYWTVLAGSGNVRWSFRVHTMSDGDSALTIATTVQLEDAAPTAGFVKTVSFPTAALTFNKDVFSYRVRREGGHANDTLASTAHLIGVLVTFYAR